MWFVPYPSRRSFVSGLIKAIGGCLVETLNEMSVDIENGPNIIVTEAIRDRFWMFSLADQQRNMTMPERVELRFPELRQPGRRMPEAGPRFVHL